MLPIIMVVLDGASDRPGARMTPLEAANTPHLDALVRRGSLGAVYTVGRGIAPESDAGVFSLLGYDPLQTRLSRGVVEAIGAGVRFPDGDLALRAGFATVEGEQLVDRRAGRNLSTEEAVELGAAVNKHLHLKEDVEFEFRPTVGHRAVVVFRSRGSRLSPEISNFDPGYVRDGIISIAQPGKGPYDIPHCEPMDRSEAAIRTAALVNEFGFKTRQILDRHPVNEKRRHLNWLPANFVLMRDAGDTKPRVQAFSEKWGLRPLLVADMPAELGIGRVLGMAVEELPPGSSSEDYRKRADLVVRMLGEYDFLYVHLKGPDEPGHDGLYQAKRERIEEIDASFFSVLEEAKVVDRAILCVTCDHSTPWAEKGHSDDPVPISVSGPGVNPDGPKRFTEIQARKGNLGLMERGTLLLERLVYLAAQLGQNSHKPI